MHTAGWLTLFTCVVLVAAHGCSDDGSATTSATAGASGPAAGGSTGVGGATTSASGGAGGAGGSEPLPTSVLVVVGSGDWSASATGMVSVLRFDYATHTPTALAATPVGTLPSFMAVDETRRLLHVGDEVDGEVRTLELASDGSLVERASATSAGNPVHLALDPTGAFLFAAHYGPGRTEVFGIDANGWVAPSLDDVATGAQTHSTLVPSSTQLFAASKGDDRVVPLTFDGSQLSAGTSIDTASGSGPRHLAMHPGGDVVYLVNELDRTLDAFDYASSPTLTPLGSALSLDPPSGPAEGTGADLHVHPSAQFLFASLRHQNVEGEIVRCDLDAQGLPSLAARTATGGITPRNFAIDASGSVLAVANQDSDNVVLFAIAGDGSLSPIETVSVAAHPFFVTFVAE